jgi:hypothetical protein
VCGGNKKRERGTAEEFFFGAKTSKTFLEHFEEIVQIQRQLQNSKENARVISRHRSRK